MQTKKQGFTLIELLVVIVIIGILATIAIPQFTSYFAKARDSERKAAVQNIATIIKVNQATQESVDYKKDNLGATMTTIAHLEALMGSQGYTLPVTGTSLYKYRYAANANDFVVAVCGEETSTEIISAGTTLAIEDLDSSTCSDTAHAIALKGTPITLTGTLLNLDW